MNDELRQKLAEAFEIIPLLAGYRPEEFRIAPLRSYTNRTFRISNKANDWILRIPRAEISRFIDREAETENLALAQKLGLAPERIWADDSGLSLSAALGQARTVTREELKQDSDSYNAETLAAYRTVLKTLSDCWMAALA